MCEMKMDNSTKHLNSLNLSKFVGLDLHQLVCVRHCYER